MLSQVCVVEDRTHYKNDEIPNDEARNTKESLGIQVVTQAKYYLASIAIRKPLVRYSSFEFCH